MDEPKVESIGWTIFSTLSTLACHALALAVLAFVLVRVVPEAIRLFEDRDVMLPNLTIAVLKLSYAFVNYWYLLALVLPLDGVVYFLLRRTNQSVNWLATVVLVLPLLLAIVMLGLATIALLMPLMTLASDAVVLDGGP